MSDFNLGNLSNFGAIAITPFYQTLLQAGYTFDTNGNLIPPDQDRGGFFGTVPADQLRQLLEQYGFNLGQPIPFQENINLFFGTSGDGGTGSEGAGQPGIGTPDDGTNNGGSGQPNFTYYAPPMYTMDDVMRSSSQLPNQYDQYSPYGQQQPAFNPYSTYTPPALPVFSGVPNITVPGVGVPPVGIPGGSDLPGTGQPPSGGGTQQPPSGGGTQQPEYSANPVLQQLLELGMTYEIGDDGLVSYYAPAGGFGLSYNDALALVGDNNPLLAQYLSGSGQFEGQDLTGKAVQGRGFTDLFGSNANQAKQVSMFTPGTGQPPGGDDTTVGIKICPDGTVVFANETCPVPQKELFQAPTPVGPTLQTPEPRQPPTCPAPWTAVRLSDGTDIEAGNLLVGMMVRTQHEDTLEWGDYPVEYVEIIPDADRAMIRFDGIDFVCSLTHKFYHEGDWVEAQDLEPGMVLSDKEVLSVEPYCSGDVVMITVSDAHTYISEGILSHNKSPVYRGDPVGIMTLPGSGGSQIDTGDGNTVIDTGTGDGSYRPGTGTTVLTGSTTGSTAGTTGARPAVQGGGEGTTVVQRPGQSIVDTIDSKMVGAPLRSPPMAPIPEPPQPTMRPMPNRVPPPGSPVANRMMVNTQDPALRRFGEQPRFGYDFFAEGGEVRDDGIPPEIRDRQRAVTSMLAKRAAMLRGAQQTQMPTRLPQQAANSPSGSPQQMPPASAPVGMMPPGQPNQMMPQQVAMQQMAPQIPSQMARPTGQMLPQQPQNTMQMGIMGVPQLRGGF